MMDFETAIKTEKEERLNSYEWEIIRHRILERDKNTCVKCGQLGKEVDHITPKCLGGTDDDDNLQILCDVCHDKKTKKDVTRLTRVNRYKKMKKKKKILGSFVD